MKKFFGFILGTLVVLFLIKTIWGSSSDRTDLLTGNIAVVEINNIIMDSMPFMEDMEELSKHSNIKALVVRIDSPGGAVGASQEIFMELKKMRAKMPVVISMGNVAASGGLYSSLGGDVVVSLPGTLTGSMGVLMESASISRLLQKVYIDPVTIKSGALKDAGNPTQPMSPEAKAYLQATIDETFEQFKADVTRERKLKPEAVKTLSDGRVVNGIKAKELGLVDQIGTFRDAVEVAKAKAKISGDVNLVYISRKPKSLLERALEEAVSPLKQWASQEILGIQSKWSPFER